MCNGRNDYVEDIIKSSRSSLDGFLDYILLSDTLANDLRPFFLDIQENY